jgi:hypothetical protein
MKMLNETQEIDQIMVDKNDVVHVREVTIVFRDDTEIARTYHRRTLAPGEDVSNQPERVRAICAVAWAGGD